MSVDAGGGGVIAVDDDCIAVMVRGLDGAGENFEWQTLATHDNFSTIVANMNSRTAFAEAQRGHIDLARALSSSASLLETMACTFKRVDSEA